MARDYWERFPTRRNYGFCLRNDGGRIVIPARLRRKLCIKPGTKVCFIEHGKNIFFQPVTKEYVLSVCGMLKDTTSAIAELLIERKKDREREQAKRKILSLPFSW